MGALVENLSHYHCYLLLHREDPVIHASPQNQCDNLAIWCTGKPSSSLYTSMVVDASWKRRKKKGGQSDWEGAVGWAGDTGHQTTPRGSKRIFVEDALQAECYAIWWGLCCCHNFWEYHH